MDKTLALLNEPILMEPARFMSLIEAHKMPMRGDVKIKEPVIHVAVGDKTMALAMGAGYTVLQGGVAIVPVMGAMFKSYGSYGYADQSEIQMHVRNAVNDPNVSAIMFLIDSPGGSVAGTMDLADEIRAAGKVKKTMAYGQDLMASAAMWIAAACNEIYTNAGAMVGSIGVITAVVDASKYLENIGVQVHVITTGEFKAAGSEYIKAKPEHLAYIQERIDAVGVQFFDAVAKGRGIRSETVKKMEAKVFTAEDAVAQRLSDGVLTFDQAFVKLQKAAGKSSGKGRAQALTALMDMEN